MCLTTIDKKTKNYKQGWKLFVKSESGKLMSVYQNSATLGKTFYPVNEWFKDKMKIPEGLPSGFGGYYPTGFHFYAKKKDAIDEVNDFFFPNDGVIRKIKVRNIVASGTQGGNQVGVAKEIFIIDDNRT